MQNTKSFGSAIKFAFKNTYTIGISWIPVALAFGMIVREGGFPFYFAGLSGIFCTFGSLQMLLFSLVSNGAIWTTALLMSVALAFRHIFYGLSFLERFKKFGAAKFYMIYMLCDELYSVYCSVEIPKEMDEKKVHLASALVLQFYWVGLCTVSALIGQVIPWDLKGVDFALTALFTVILIDMILSGKGKLRALPAVIALVSGIVCLLIFGADKFLMPAFLIVICVLMLARPMIEKEA